MQLIYKFIYAHPVNFIIRNLFKGLNSLFGLHLRTAISGIVTIPLDKNKSIRLSSNETCFLTQNLFYEGPLNYEFSNIFVDLVKQCTSFFDIGANIGFFSVLAKKYNNDIKIVAFEPGKGSYYFLTENLRINGCETALPVNAALTDRTGKIEFHEITNDKFPYLDHFLSGASTTVNMNYDLPTNTYEVNCLTLDDYVEKNSITSLDLIKLDTEFNEHLVLSKSQNTLKKFRPILISEVYPNVADLFYEQVKGLDFILFHYTQSRLKRINSFHEVASSSDRNFFLVPSEKIRLIEKHIAV
jgi:FkbM family methyltransferase